MNYKYLYVRTVKLIRSHDDKGMDQTLHQTEPFPLNLCIQINGGLFILTFRKGYYWACLLCLITGGITG